jgi:hypothetical protein
VAGDFFAGSLRADDTRLSLLEARLPALRLYYTGLRERLAPSEGHAEPRAAAVG